MALQRQLCLWCSCQPASWMTDQLFLKWGREAIRDFSSTAVGRWCCIHTHTHWHRHTLQETAEHTHTYTTCTNKHSKHTETHYYPTLTHRSIDTQHLSQEAVGPAWLIKHTQTHTHKYSALLDIVNYCGNNCISAVSKLNSCMLAGSAAGRDAGLSLFTLLCCW